MNPKEEDEPEDEKRGPRRRPDPNPFDELFRGFGLDPSDFDKMFEQMQRTLQDMMRNMGGLEPGKPYVHGFTFKIGPDGKPQVSGFGNKTQRPSVKGAKPMLSPEREPIADVIEEPKQIAATLEIPGVDKKDIDIRVTEDEIEINVDTPARKYHKLLRLPARVKPPTTKATYKNGVLDVTVEKQKMSESKKGYRVNVE